MKFSTKFISSSNDYSTFEKPIPAPFLRRTFEISETEICEAEITICGLGFYELFINGKRITKGLLSPYISNPDDFLYYDNYDLKSILHTGKNVIGIILGNGMQNCFGGAIWAFDKARYRSAPKVALDFSVKYSDNSSLNFEADESFVCTNSPIIMDDLRAGEWYDARLEIGDWSLPEYDDSNWHKAISVEPPRGECRLCDIDPIVITKEIAPINICSSKISGYPAIDGSLPNIPIPEDEQMKNAFLYDFGINAAGLCRIHIKNAKPGQKLVLQFGEKVMDGGLELANIRYLPMRYNHRDIYICKGGDETWMPRFTYHGFRYVLVSGITEEQATNDLLTYVVMNTKMDNRASFHCSDKITNKLWNAAIVSDLANFYHFPTDCPHREKNGWTGDISVSAEQMIFTLSPERNLREWLRNVNKTMDSSGNIQAIVPSVAETGWYGTGVAWDNATVVVPYYSLLYRGDIDICRENSGMILRYIHYLSNRRNANGLIDFGLGDWCPATRIYNCSRAPIEFTSTVLAIDYCAKAKEIFNALKMDAEAEYAENVRKQLYNAAREYLIDTKSMTALGRCQASQAMAIYYDLFTETEKPIAAKKLVQFIADKKGSFDCGILGMRVLFHVLSEYGYTDLAFKMITKTEYPSYGYLIDNGSTSLWEFFAFADRPQSSLNHHFFGDIISWFLQNLAGIHVNPHHRNPNEIRFQPRFIEALNHAYGTYESLAGKVSIHWERQGEDIVCTCTVPNGSPAEFVTDTGWQLDNGLTHMRFSGTVNFKLIREDKRDTCVKYYTE